MDDESDEATRGLCPADPHNLCPGLFFFAWFSELSFFLPEKILRAFDKFVEAALEFGPMTFERLLVSVGGDVDRFAHQEDQPIEWQRKHLPVLPRHEPPQYPPSAYLRLFS